MTSTKLISPNHLKASTGPRAGRGRPRIAGLREKILSSAMKLFGECGLTQVSIEQLAAVAGVGKGSIYREFGSKEELYAAAVIEGLNQLLAQTEGALQTASSSEEALAATIRQASNYFWTRGEFFALMRDPAALPADQLKHFRRERAGLARLIVKILRTGAAEGVVRADLDFELASQAILGMIRGIRRHHAAGVTPEQAAVTIIAMVAHGLFAASAEGVPSNAESPLSK